jgi:hypothetical protein
MMNERLPLSFASKLTLYSLAVASAGVVIQIVSGVPYPAVPPVFFLLAVPAALVDFGPWRWTPAAAVVAGLFLVSGLFASGSSLRLFDLIQIGGVGGSVGLWVQMLAVLVATVAALIATLQNYRGGHGSAGERST